MSGNVFISYSHEDEEWKNRVVKHLQVLARQGHLETWDDRRIGGGEDWYEAIVRAIEAGSVAVLLVSANSLTSEFILKEEVPRLLALRDSGRLRRLIPLVIKPCPWQGVDWLKRMNMRPRDGKALSAMSDAAIDEALAAFALEVYQLMMAPDPPPWEKTISRGCNALIDFLKCDRDAQQHAFNSRFTTWFQGQRGLPQFHIIHGRKEDRPGSLVKRLGRIELDMAVAWLKKHKHLETTAAPLFKEVAWPVMTAVDQLDLAPQRNPYDLSKVPPGTGCVSGGQPISISVVGTNVGENDPSQRTANGTYSLKVPTQPVTVYVRVTTKNQKDGDFNFTFSITPTRPPSAR